MKKKIVTEIMKRRDARTRSVIGYRDIQDQPKSRYILMYEPGPLQGTVIAVDKVVLKSNILTGYVVGQKQPILQLSPHIPWSLVARELIEIIDNETMLRQSSDDNKLMEELHKELNPEKEKLKTGQYA